MTLKEKLHQKQPVGCFWFSLGSIPLIEFAADAGAEAIVFDAQHGLWTRDMLESAIGHMTCSKATPLVRVAECTRHHISSALDAGAEGVIVPLIETAEQAVQAIEWSQYPPIGSRSGGGLRPLRDFEVYKQHADQTTVTAVMIETKTGLENVEKIAQTDKLDMLFIGTGDLSLSLGVSHDDPFLEAAIQRIKQASAQADIACGIFTPTIDQAMARRQQGFHLVVLSDDITANRSLYQDRMAEFLSD